MKMKERMELQPGTLEYIGQCFLELMPHVETNGLHRLADSVAINPNNGLKKLHFRNARVVMLPKSEDIEIHVHEKMHPLRKQDVALLTQTGAQGTFLKHPDYDNVNPRQAQSVTLNHKVQI